MGWALCTDMDKLWVQGSKQEVSQIFRPPVILLLILGRNYGYNLRATAYRDLVVKGRQGFDLNF
jgi:hypothetical protein